jgi:signal transduction histidine kinase
VRGYAAPVQLDYRACDLAQVWREAWAKVTALHPGRDAALEEQAGGPELTCQADPSRLGQVFRNLFENSLEACLDPVRVRVACAEATLGCLPALRVSVRDCPVWGRGPRRPRPGGPWRRASRHRENVTPNW